MLLGKGAADDDDARQQGGRRLGVLLQRVPLGIEVQRHADALVLHLSGGDEGLGKQRGAAACQQGGQTLGVLALPLDGDVLLRIQSVAGEDGVQRVLGRGALSAGVKRAAAKIGDGMNAVVGIHDVEHAQRIDGQHLYGALRVVVERGGEVGGDGGDIRAPLNEGGRHLVDGADDVKGARAGLLHHLHHAHGGRAFEGHDAHGGFVRECSGKQQQTKGCHDGNRLFHNT